MVGFVLFIVFKKTHMKRIVLSALMLITVAVAQAQIIDAQDSVVFDLSQATEQSGYVEFPVYFLSDDIINAVDFSMKYNTVDFAFDTIIKLAGYLQVTSNLAADTTLYYTSYSLQTITNDTPLVKVRFTVLTPGQFCSNDLTSVVAYLNGDLCSVTVIDCIPNGVEDQESGKTITGIYPNPVTENVTVEFSVAGKGAVTISVIDIAGKIVYQTARQGYTSGQHKLNLNLSSVENGVYTVLINSENETKSARISIVR